MRGLLLGRPNRTIRLVTAGLPYNQCYRSIFLIRSLVPATPQIPSSTVPAMMSS